MKFSWLHFRCFVRWPFFLFVVSSLDYAKCICFVPEAPSGHYVTVPETYLKPAYLPSHFTRASKLVSKWQQTTSLETAGHAVGHHDLDGGS